MNFEESSANLNTQKIDDYIECLKKITNSLEEIAVQSMKFFFYKIIIYDF